MRRALLLCGVLAGCAALLALAGGSAGREARLSVGLVLGPAGVSSPYDRLSVAGLRKAVRKLGIEAKVLTPSQKEGYLPSLLYLARRGYGLVIAGSALEADAVDRAAVAYPDVRFAVLDTSQEAFAHRPRNVIGVTFAAQEASYLAGFLAGQLERQRPGPDTISSIGGVKAPPVDAFIAGYQAGARRASPGIRTLNTYIRNFSDPARCEATALSQIARGAGVVFAVAGYCGVGALRAAGRKGVWGVGVDVDQSTVGPQVLTSVVKHVDAAVYEVIRLTRSGRLLGGRTLDLGLREDGVGLGRISPKVPRAFVAQVERIRRQIVSGKIAVPTTLG